jgi:hypothetical protein
MGTPGCTPRPPQAPGPAPRADGRWAAAKRTGATRRALAAERTRQDGGGTARQADRVGGWGRHTVEVGRAERRPGRRGLGAQAACRGRRRWDDAPPPGAAAQAPHAPPCRPRRASPRLPAPGAWAGRSAPGSSAAPRPAPSPRAAGRPRRGVRLRHGVQAPPQTQRTEPAARVANRQNKRPTPRQREGANACASLGKRRGPWGRGRAVGGPGARPPPGRTPAGAGSWLARGAAGRPRAGSAPCPWAVPTTPGLVSWRRLPPRGRPGPRQPRALERGDSATGTMGLHAGVGGRRCGIAGGRVWPTWASPGRDGMPRPPPAKRRRWSAAGAWGRGPGRGRRWSRGRRGWQGPRGCPGSASSRWGRGAVRESKTGERGARTPCRRLRAAWRGILTSPSGLC